MKVINMYSLWASLAAVAALAMFATSPAHAATNVIYPGVQCVVDSESPSKSTTMALGSIGNTDHTNWLYVDCPATRDWPSTTGVGSGVVAVVSESVGVGCELFGLNISGEYATWSSSNQYEGATTTSNNTQYLGFGSMPANDHYFYFCYIPPTYGGKVSFVNAYALYQY